MTEQTVDAQILSGSDTTTPKEPKASRRDDAGKFSKVAAEDSALDAAFKKYMPERESSSKAPAPAEQAQPEKAQETGATPAVSVPKALELDGFTAEDLQGLTPERIAALEAKAAKRQSDIGKKLSERAKAEAPATATPETAKAPEQVAQQTYKELVKGVGELLGEDVGDALGGVLEKALSPLVDRLQRAESFLQQRQMAELDHQVSEARVALGKEFPSLKDDATHQRVIETMNQLADPKKYSSVEELMRAACRLELFDEAVSAASASKPRNDTSRKNGHPTAPVQTASPSATKTREQLEDEALDSVFSKHISR